MASVDAAELRWRGTAIAWAAATWALSHDPLLGDCVTESGKTRLLHYPGAIAAEQPDIAILYVFENGTITIHDVRFEQSRFEQAGRS